jgi:hypothetical protein
MGHTYGEFFGMFALGMIVGAAIVLLGRRG